MRIKKFNESGDFNPIQQEILDDIKRLEVTCPECEYMFSDPQYTCTTCWCEGGGGRINVFQWLKEHPESFTKK